MAYMVGGERCLYMVTVSSYDIGLEMNVTIENTLKGVTRMVCTTPLNKMCVLM